MAPPMIGISVAAARRWGHGWSSSGGRRLGELALANRGFSRPRSWHHDWEDRQLARQRGRSSRQRPLAAMASGLRRGALPGLQAVTAAAATCIPTQCGTSGAVASGLQRCVRQAVSSLEARYSSTASPTARRANVRTGREGEGSETGPLYRAAKRSKCVIIWLISRRGEIISLWRSLFLACQLDLIVICPGVSTASIHAVPNGPSRSARAKSIF